MKFVFLFTKWRSRLNIKSSLHVAVLYLMETVVTYLQVEHNIHQRYGIEYIKINQLISVFSSL